MFDCLQLAIDNGGFLTITLMMFSPFGTVKEMRWNNVLLNRLIHSTQQ